MTHIHALAIFPPFPAALIQPLALPAAIDAYGSGRIFLTTEQKQAAREGSAYSQRAYADVWALGAKLVDRVRTFLGANFHWHGRLVQ